MKDVTEAAGRIFAAYDQICRDLASLAADFGAAVEERLERFQSSGEYSHSPSKLFAKPAHAWYWETRMKDAGGKLTEIRFAAMLAFFQSARTMKKIAPAGRPELWFYIGSLKGSSLKADDMGAQKVASFLAGEVYGTFTPPLHMGPPASLYTYDDENEQWRTWCLGLELGDVDRPEAIEEKVLPPLLAVV